MRATVRAMRVMRVMRAIFASIFFFQLVWEVVDFSPRNIDLAPDYHLTIAVNRPPAILKAEMTLGTSTTSLPGYSLFPWEIDFKFSYKSA